MTTTLTVPAHPIPAGALERGRAAGHDDFGNPFMPLTADGGEPLGLPDAYRTGPA